MTTTDTKAIRENMKALDGVTPGPWSAIGPRKMEIVGRIHLVLNPEDYPTAFVPAWDRPEAGEVDGTDEAIANARLIVAAPDMRETILALCDETERLRAENERLRAALAPFSEESAYWFSHNYNREDRPVEGFPGYTAVMTCGDLFNARAALAAMGDSHD